MNSVIKFFLLFLLPVFSCHIFDIENSDIQYYSNRFNNITENDGWLIMIYMSATGTLEEESITDLNNIELGYNELANRDDVDIVILYDRGPGYSVSNGDLTGSYLYSYEESGFHTVENVDGWRDSFDQEESMGDIDTLESFLSWSVDSYARRNKALILWNHGGGVGGVAPDEVRAICWDTEDSDSNTNEVLFVDEIQQLLRKYFTQDNRLDILGFDACYMGMVEIVYELRDTVEYIVASSAAETGGWVYQNFIPEIDSGLTAEEFAVNIVDTYRVFSQVNNLSNTLAVYYVPAINLFVDKLNIVFKSLLQIEREEILEVRSEVDTYYTSSNQLHAVMYPYIDLGSFISRLKRFPELLEGIGEVESSISNVIIQSFDYLNIVKDDEFGEISLFFPENSNDYGTCWWYTGDDTGTYGNIDFCNDTVWEELLDNWYVVN